MKAALRKGNSLLTCLKNPFFGIENSQATLKITVNYPLPISFVGYHALRHAINK